MEHKIKSGMTDIFYYSTPVLHSFDISIYLRSGVMFESKSENGITHIFEHMCFRNINYLLSGGLYTLLDRYGLEFEATTYKEFVTFSITGSRDYFNEAAKIITMILEPFTLPHDQYIVELDRIKAEIRESAETGSLDTFTTAYVWKGTSLENSIAGTCGSVSRIGQRRLVAKQAEILSRDNMFFYVTGSFTEKNIAFLDGLVSRYRLTESVFRDNIAPIPENFFHRGYTVAIKNSTCTCVKMSFDVDMHISSMPERNILFDMLFSGYCSKVYQRLSEKRGLIYSFDSCFEQYKNIGNISFSFEVARAHLFSALSECVTMFREIKSGVGTSPVLSLPPYTLNYAMDLDKPDTLNWIFAYEGKFLDAGFYSVQQRRDSFSEVTEQDVVSLANRIFTGDNLILTLKCDKKRTDADKLGEIIQKL